MSRDPRKRGSEARGGLWGRTFQIKRTEKAEVLKWKLACKGGSGWSRAAEAWRRGRGGALDRS